MRRFKCGIARSGPKGSKVKSRQQAVAIGLSKAQKKALKCLKNPVNHFYQFTGLNNVSHLVLLKEMWQIMILVLATVKK